MPREPHFGDLIQGLLSAGLSRSEIARQIKVSPPYIGRLAVGERREPSWSVGQALIGLARKHAAPTVKKTGQHCP